MNENRNYTVNWESIVSAFPPTQKPPNLLKDFSQWAQTKTWGSVGCFELGGCWVDKVPLAYDSYLLRNEFAFFMHLPEGSSIGFWIVENSKIRVENRQALPIVLIGSEGELEVLAESLESFLAQLAIGFFETSDSDLMVHEDSVSILDELEKWLQKKLSVKSVRDLVQPISLGAIYKSYLETWLKDREIYWRNHPTMKKMSELLSDYKPTSDVPWASTALKAEFSEDSFSLQVLSRGWKDVPIAALIRPLLKELRDQQFKDNPQWSPWNEAHFSLNVKGNIYPRFY